MKVNVFFENEDQSCRYNALILERIRSHCPEDLIILISAGEFSANGELLQPSCSLRAQEYVKKGADLVLSLPTASVLGGFGKKEFARAALAQRLHCDEQLIIPCRPLAGQPPEECGKQLKSYAMLMLKDEHGYRSRLNENLKEEMPMRKAQAKAVCDSFPGAKDLLCFPENRSALWILDAMLQLYYMAPVVFVEAPGLRDCGEEGLDAGGTLSEKIIVSKVAQLLETASMETLLDISGSTMQMAEALLGHKESVRAAKSLGEILHILESAAPDRVRLFLVKAILGVTKNYMLVCGLHTFVPYSYVTASNPEKEEQIKEAEEKSWVPLITEDVLIPRQAEDYPYLLRIDQDAARLRG